MSKFFQELMKKDKSDLKEELLESRKELFNLKVQSRLNKLEKSSFLTKARKNVARILTAIQSKTKEVKR